MIFLTQKESLVPVREPQAKAPVIRSAEGKADLSKGRTA